MLLKMAFQTASSIVSLLTDIMPATWFQKYSVTKLEWILSVNFIQFWMQLWKGSWPGNLENCLDLIVIQNDIEMINQPIPNSNISFPRDGIWLLTLYIFIEEKCHLTSPPQWTCKKNTPENHTFAYVSMIDYMFLI